MTATWNDVTPEAAEVFREAKETMKACLVYFRTLGFVPWEIARRLYRDLTPGQMRRLAATLVDIDDEPVAEEVMKLADKAEAEYGEGT